MMNGPSAPLSPSTTMGRRQTHAALEQVPAPAVRARGRFRRPEAPRHWPLVVERMLAEQSRSWRRLANRIARSRALANARVWLIEGTRPGVGVTSVALAVASALAGRVGLRVALVDGSRRRKRIEGSNPSPMCLRDLLTGTGSWERSHSLPKGASVWVLPDKISLDEPPSAELGPRMRRLRRDFDLIMIDGGCFRAHRTAILGLVGVDIGLLVARPVDERTDRGAAAWRRRGPKLLGIIENEGAAPSFR